MHERADIAPGEARSCARVYLPWPCTATRPASCTSARRCARISVAWCSGTAEKRAGTAPATVPGLDDRRRGAQWAREITPACRRARTRAAAGKHAAATARSEECAARFPAKGQSGGLTPLPANGAAPILFLGLDLVVRGDVEALGGDIAGLDLRHRGGDIAGRELGHHLRHRVVTGGGDVDVTLAAPCRPRPSSA